MLAIGVGVETSRWLSHAASIEENQWGDGERSGWLIGREVDNFKDGPVLDRHCKAEVANPVAHILDAVGEDIERDGLMKTPDRVVRMYDEILLGYKVDPVKLLNGAVFDVDYHEMVIVSDIDFHSMCEHHLLPIVGKAHVAYVPENKVVGLSKIPLVVEAYASDCRFRSA